MKALQSIAANSCCGPCQEAAKVASQALDVAQPVTSVVAEEIPADHAFPQSSSPPPEKAEGLLTADDCAQIADGMEHFIMDGDGGEVDAIWQPFVDKLKAQARLLASSSPPQEPEPPERRGEQIETGP
jgi:hypothetical protein